MLCLLELLKSADEFLILLTNSVLVRMSWEIHLIFRALPPVERSELKIFPFGRECCSTVPFPWEQEVQAHHEPEGIKLRPPAPPPRIPGRTSNII